MLKRFSNITILVLCGFLVVGIIVTRRVDTAIEVNVERQKVEREKIRDYTITCAQQATPLVPADTATWIRVQYTLPSFSSYNLDRKDGGWYLEDKVTDATSTNKYFGKITNAAWLCTVAHQTPEMLKVPDYILEIITSQAETLAYKTYVVDTTYLIEDQNGSMYYGNADSLFWQLYFGKHRFIPELLGQ